MNPDTAGESLLKSVLTLSDVYLTGYHADASQRLVWFIGPCGARIDTDADEWVRTDGSENESRGVLCARLVDPASRDS